MSSPHLPSKAHPGVWLPNILEHSIHGHRSLLAGGPADSRASATHAQPAIHTAYTHLQAAHGPPHSMTSSSVFASKNASRFFLASGARPMHGVRAVVGLWVVALTCTAQCTAHATRLVERPTELPGRSVLPMATQLPSGGESLTVLLKALNSATPELAEVLGGQQAFTVFAPTDQVGPHHGG